MSTSVNTMCKLSEYPELSATEVSFVYYYILMGEDSGVKAYIASFGESNSTRAKNKAATLLQKGVISSAIDKMRDVAFQETLQAMPGTIMRDIVAVNNLDIADFYESDGSAKELNKIEQSKRRYIDGIGYTLNQKTGEYMVEYSIPKKSDTASRVLNVIKMQNLLKGGEEGVDNAAAMREAMEQRNKIRAEVKKERLGINDETKD